MTVGLVAGDNYGPSALGTFGNSLIGKRRPITPMAQQILNQLQYAPPRNPNNQFPRPGTPAPHPNDFPRPYVPDPHRQPYPNPLPHPGQPVPPPDYPNPGVPVYRPRSHRIGLPNFPYPNSTNPMSYAAYQRLTGQY